MNFNKLISTIDMHVEGEPLRIITSGLPEIKGKTQLEKRAYCMKNLDTIRKILMYEPRGHHGMYGCIITPPAEPDSDFGVLFMHNEGWSTMCGHGIIAVVKMVVETGRFLHTKEKYVIDTPAGKVTAYANCKDNKVESVSFDNVPSFVYKNDLKLNINGKDISGKIAFGGAFYAVINSKDIGLSVDFENLNELQKWGTKIKNSIESEMEVVHPIEKGLKGIYGVVFSDAPEDSKADLRNVTIFANAQIDRSPCGTATCARLATLEEEEALQDGKFIHESITGGHFIGEIIAYSKVGKYKAIVPRVTGNSFITGLHQFVMDPDDTLKSGFLLESM